MVSATDQKEIDRRRRAFAEEQKVEDTILLALLGRADGRKYLWRQLSKMHCFEQVLDLNANNVLGRVAFNEGQRALGLELLSNLTRLSPQLFMTMMEEANSKVLVEKQNDGRSDDD